MTKTIRLPVGLVRLAEARAAELGLAFNDIVEKAMTTHFDLPHNPSFDVLEAVRDHLQSQYPDRRGFPQDVTLEVFHHIQADEHLRSLYDAATTDEDGQAVDSLRGSLHRRIGRSVKAVLGAKVVGRSLPLDPEKDLISSHALLEPQDS
jgi:acetylornithine deacetylase/succinyl-diaminopimelate desuccinylase-like protein